MFSGPIYNTKQILKYAKNDHHDKKCVKQLNIYNGAFEELNQTFQNFSEKPTQKEAVDLLNQLKQVKVIRTKFNESNFISLLPLSFKQALLKHDSTFHDMEASISQILMGEVELIPCGIK